MPSHCVSSRTLEQTALNQRLNHRRIVICSAHALLGRGPEAAIASSPVGSCTINIRVANDLRIVIAGGY